MQDLKHQTETVNRFKNSDTSALFMETGTGKNRIMIRLAEHHWQENRVQAVIVITTSSLVMNWALIELPKHASIPYHTFIWKKSKRIRLSPALQYLIVNIDAIPTPPFQKLWKEFLKYYPHYMMIIDESTLVKNHKADRTKAVLYIARRARIRCIASGTPITKGPLDLFSQMNMLREGILGFTSYYAFRGRYAEVVQEYNGPGRSYQKVKGYRNIGDLVNRLANHAAIIKLKDCVDMPDKIYERVHTDFTEEQARTYNDLVQRSITYIDNNVITAMNSVALINRLLQICSGQIKVDDKYIAIDTDRFEAVKQYVEQAESPVILWSSFIQSSINAAAYLGPLTLHIPAGLRPAALYAQLQLFKTGKVPSIIVSPASLGHGHTLVESHTVGYISHRFNVEHRLQSEARTYRIGQTSPVLYTDFITKGTIEERVLEVHKAQLNIADFVLDKARLKWLINGDRIQAVQDATFERNSRRTGSRSPGTLERGEIRDLFS